MATHPAVTCPERRSLHGSETQALQLVNIQVKSRAFLDQETRQKSYSHSLRSLPWGNKVMGGGWQQRYLWRGSSLDSHSSINPHHALCLRCNSEGVVFCGLDMTTAGVLKCPRREGRVLNSSRHFFFFGWVGSRVCVCVCVCWSGGGAALGL